MMKNKFLFVFILVTFICANTPIFAQQVMQLRVQKRANPIEKNKLSELPPPEEESNTPPEMKDYEVVKLRSLDKITARSRVFEAKIGSTVKFGELYIKMNACRKPVETEKGSATAFMQVWENSAEDDSKWIFSGWVFASSPGLSTMDHPVYDVWVLDCLNQKTSSHPQGKSSKREEKTLEESANLKPET